MNVMDKTLRELLADAWEEGVRAAAGGHPPSLGVLDALFQYNPYRRPETDDS